MSHDRLDDLYIRPAFCISQADHRRPSTNLVSDRAGFDCIAIDEFREVLQRGEIPVLWHLAQPFNAAVFVLGVFRKAHSSLPKVAGTFHVPWPNPLDTSYVASDSADGIWKMPAPYG